MQPNDPFQPAPTGIDYLNQIAPPPQPAGFDRKSKIIMAVLGAIGVLSLVFILMMSTGQTADDSSTPMKIAARLQKLETIATKYNDKLRDSDLQMANSSLVAVLMTANQSIAEPLAAVSVDAKKKAKEIAALDPSTEIEEDLDDKFLTTGGMLDTHYGTTMNSQLVDTIMIMKRLSSSTNSKSMKEFLNKNITDLETLQKQFEKFSAS